MGLVHSVISALTIPQYLYEDAVAQGYFTLVRSANKFDESKGKKFSTYAYMSVRFGILNLLRKEKKHSHTICLHSNIKSPEKIRIMDHLPDLSQREQKIVELYLQRKTIKEIGIAHNTSGVYEYQIMKNIKNRI